MGSFLLWASLLEVGRLPEVQSFLRCFLDQSKELWSEQRISGGMRMSDRTQSWEFERDGAWGTQHGAAAGWNLPFLSLHFLFSPVFTLCLAGQRRRNSSPKSRTYFFCSFLPPLAKMKKPIPGYQEHSGVRAGIMCEEIAEQVFVSLFSFTSASCSCQLKICIRYT